MSKAKSMIDYPWMNGTLVHSVSRGYARYAKGQKVKVHYSPAQHDSTGKLTRTEGYVVLGKVIHGRNGDFQTFGFLFLDEVNAEWNGSKYLARDYSTSCDPDGVYLDSFPEGPYEDVLSPA